MSNKSSDHALTASRLTNRILAKAGLTADELSNCYFSINSDSYGLALSVHENLMKKIRESTNLPMVFLGRRDNSLYAAMGASPWSYEEFAQDNCEFKYVGNLPTALETEFVGWRLGDVMEGLEFLQDELIVAADISEHRSIFTLTPQWVPVASASDA